ncbi:MAG: hypothetical protein Q4E47_00970 [Candidatus Saccharibacteria bacterium]|nr:hypothetical protein [Candidatus Saccharibacteria bacterium]
MLDRHDLNHILMDDTTGVYDAVYDELCKDYPALSQPMEREVRNELLKTMVHDFADCWTVDWWDDLEAFRRFKVALDVPEDEVVAAFLDLYDIAKEQNWPHSIEMYNGDLKDATWDREGESEAFINCPMRLTRQRGEPVYGHYAHDAVWRILERWFDKAVRECGCCEQEVKWALYKLADSSLEAQYPRERDAFMTYTAVMILGLILVPILGFVWFGETMFLIFGAVGAICGTPYFIKNVKMFKLVAKRRFCVDPDEEDIPLPEAVKQVREELEDFQITYEGEDKENDNKK